MELDWLREVRRGSLIGDSSHSKGDRLPEKKQFDHEILGKVT